MVFVSGGALLWHFCHQRTRWIIQMAEAAAWMQELDLCMWSPECRLIAATWMLSHESIKIFWNMCIYLMQEWEDGLITMGDLRSKSDSKWLRLLELGQYNPDYCPSLGCFGAFAAVVFSTLFLWQLESNPVCVKRWYLLLQSAKKTTTRPPGCHNSLR